MNNPSDGLHSIEDIWYMANIHIIYWKCLKIFIKACYSTCSDANNICILNDYPTTDAPDNFMCVVLVGTCPGLSFID